MAPYEALYGRLCRSPVYWTEVGERSAIGLDLVKDTSKRWTGYGNVFSWLRDDKRAMLTDGDNL